VNGWRRTATDENAQGGKSQARQPERRPGRQAGYKAAPPALERIAMSGPGKDGDWEGVGVSDAKGIR